MNEEVQLYKAVNGRSGNMINAGDYLAFEMAGEVTCCGQCLDIFLAILLLLYTDNVWPIELLLQVQ